MQDIERAAGAAFRDIGMPEIADDEPLSLDELAAYRRARRAWVAVGQNGRLVAYLVADLVDGSLHVGQVSVHPASARRGVGRAMLEHTARPGSRRGPGGADPDRVHRGAVERALLPAVRIPPAS